MKKFDDVHRKAFGATSKVPKMGYPDCGDGYYSKKLTYANWFKMNNGQRAQLNYSEQLPFILTTTLIGGVYYPWSTFVC